MCKSILSSAKFPTEGRIKHYERQCVICRLEGRHASIVTTYCLTHRVSLCHNTFIFNHTSVAACPYEWNCWKKFHEFYQPKFKAYSNTGRIKKGTKVYQEVWSGDPLKRKKPNVPNVAA